MKHNHLSRDLLAPDEVDRLLVACGDGYAGLRNRALISLMVATGVRISEALAIEARDLDLEHRRLHVRRGKGGKERHVWIHPDGLEPVHRWRDTRRVLGFGRRAPVFCSLRGSMICSSYVRRLMPRLAERAGVGKRVHAHALRHAFACKAHRANISLRALQLQFGHENIATTSRYLERLGLNEVFDEFDRAFA